MDIKSQRFGASSLPKFYYALQKNPFATPRTVLQWPSLFKNSFVIGRNSARCSYHADLFDSCLPWLVIIEYLTICWYAPEFQNFPELIEIEKGWRSLLIFPLVFLQTTLSLWNRKSCRNVRIWRKRAAVRRNSHWNLKKSFGIKVSLKPQLILQVRIPWAINPSVWFYFLYKSDCMLLFFVWELRSGRAKRDVSRQWWTVIGLRQHAARPQW